ncbi:MAG: PAS domain-containing protein [Halorhabdus sp.]
MAPSSLTEIQQETLSLFESPGEPRTTTEVADLLDLGRRSTYERLERLVDHGRLDTKKVGGNGRVWWRPPKNTNTTPNWSATAEPLIDDVLDGAEVGIFVLDENFDVAWISDTTERYFGLDRERVIGRDKRRLVEGEVASLIDDGGTFTETVLATYNDNTYSEQFVCRVTPEDGEERWLEHHSRPVESGAYAGGRVELYYDITAQRESERARHETERRFRTLVDAVEEYAIFMLDTDGYVETWNEGARQIKGYEHDEIVGEHVSTFYTDEDGEGSDAAENLSRAAAQGSIEEEGWRVRADGSRFWAHFTITAIRDDDGHLRGFAKVVRDMTEGRKRERELRHEREMLERVLETVPVGVGVASSEGELVLANERASEILGGDPDEAFSGQNRQVYDTVGDRVLERERPYRRVLETGDPLLDWQCQIEHSDGERRWVSVNAIPLEGEEGKVEGVVVAGEDITQLKERAHGLESQRDNLASELKELFERIEDGFFALDHALQFTYVNDRAGYLLGRPPDELVGQYIWDAFEPGTEAEAAFEEALETMESSSFDEYYEPLETWFESHVYPSEDGLSVYFTDITERNERERKLKRQREQLAAINSLNEVVQDITEAVINRSTREEIEKVVVEGLAEAESFSFAWIGAVDGATEEVRLHQEAGVEGYLDNVTISADPDDERSSGPTGQALLTDEMQVVQEIRGNPGHEPWRDHVGSYDARSSAAIPIIHEETTYGVLNIYAHRPYAFDEVERRVVAQLGEVVGHAIAAVERKRALMSDEVVELEFHIPDAFVALDTDAESDGRITLDQAVPVGDGSYLVYGTATDGAWPAVGSITDALPHWESIRDVSRRGDLHRFEVTVTEPPDLTVVASRGGYVQKAVIEDGDYHVTVHLPPTGDNRAIVEAVKDAYPTADLVAKRQFSRTDDAGVRFERLLQEELTERQLAAVETAFHAGFFEWPRESDGGDIADSLGVSPPTFHQHLRKAEQKILAELLDGESSSARPVTSRNI